MSRSPGRRALFALIAVAMGWLLLEGAAFIALRTLPAPSLPARPDLPTEAPDWMVSAKEALQRRFFRPDEHVLWTLQPGHREPPREPWVWGREDLVINDNGHRSPPMAAAKAPGVRRVLVLGGSHPFGMWVGNSEVYSAVLSDRLNAAQPGRWEVMNACAPGHTSFQGRQYLAHHAAAFEPDYVVFDLGNNDDLALAADWAAPDHVVYSVRRARKVANRAAASAVYRLLQRLLQPAVDAATTDSVRVPPAQRDANFKAIEAQSRQDGYELLYVSQVDVGAPDNLGAAECNYRFADHHPLFDVCGLFEPLGEAAADYFVDPIHANAAGHRLIGEALAKRFEELGWMKE